MNMQGLTLERKFIALKGQENFALNWLSHMCLPDPKYPIGKLNTLYYDTFDLKFYREKINGDYLKTKVRLRWYDEIDNTPPKKVFLEIKMRDGSARKKVRKILPIDSITHKRPAFEDVFFRKLIDEFSKDFHDKIPFDLFPVINIKYERRRFFCPFSGARVCLDTNITTNWINMMILPGYDSSFIPFTVIEIKDAKMVEIPWLKELYNMRFLNRSFSKYGSCIDEIIGGD